MGVNEVLLVGLALFIGFLFVIEWYTAKHGIPTISERVQALHRSFPAIGFIAGVIAGWFGAHFFS